MVHVPISVQMFAFVHGSVPPKCRRLLGSCCDLAVCNHNACTAWKLPSQSHAHPFTSPQLERGGQPSRGRREGTDAGFDPQATGGRVSSSVSVWWPSDVPVRRVFSAHAMFYAVSVKAIGGGV